MFRHCLFYVNAILLIKTLLSRWGEHIMSATRKELVWSIKKNLYKLTGCEAYHLARDITTDSQIEDLDSSNEEAYVGLIMNYIMSDTLLDSEDEGISQLLMLNDM